MINKKRARKATQWLRGYLRAKYGDAIQVAHTEKGLTLVARDNDSVVDLEELSKSLPKEITASIGNISTSVTRARR